jgi:hypothetical protein
LDLGQQQGCIIDSLTGYGKSLVHNTESLPHFSKLVHK